jgi:hypothetical protein
MGKKVKRKTYVSKGQRDSVSRSTVKAARQDVSELTKALHKIEAWRAGKNPWITVEGTQSNQRFVRVRANALYGDPKKSANLFGGKADVS